MSQGTLRNLVGAAVLGGCVAFGLGTLGHTLGDAVHDVQARQRYVTVKGLAEREVPADLAIWPLTFIESNDDLVQLQQKVDADRQVVYSFLKKSGFTPEEISDSAPSITDLFAQDYREGSGRPHYSAQVTVTLRTNRVDAIDKTVRLAGELVKSGIVLQGGYGAGAQFFFTKLNDIKPQMIAEATQSARKAAEQFAQDSKSRVGSIKSAQQGLFSIEDRDQYTPQLKKVRVVTTVDYFLVGD